ncbi:MAG TPA: ROK family protein [Acidimicrobiales bacterium]|nr:ROK family protein [Acidimicrobiales bacterium]
MAASTGNGATPAPTKAPPKSPAKAPAKSPARRVAPTPRGAGGAAVKRPAGGAARATAPAAAARRRTPRPAPRTLAIDIGGTGLKASVLDDRGNEVVDPVRVDTTYPMPPERLVEVLGDLVAPLPGYDRVSVGFPGMVRKNAILTAPHFVTKKGPGSRIIPELSARWGGYPLGAAIEQRLGRPTRVANDADVQGLAVIAGVGLELVVTLGTGVGTGLFYEGRLMPHLELAHHPFRHDETYNEQLGEAARKRIGRRRWNRRVRLAVDTLHNLLLYDRLYVGGGNSKRVDFDLGPKATVVDNAAGILGGLKLWELQDPV